MNKIIILILAITLSGCTFSGYSAGNDDDEIMGRISAAPAWYCGDELVSGRAAARVLINLGAAVFGVVGVRIPDACAEYRRQRDEIRAQIEAEEIILREGLIGQQEIPNG